MRYEKKSFSDSDRGGKAIHAILFFSNGSNHYVMLLVFLIPYPAAKPLARGNPRNIQAAQRRAASVLLQIEIPFVRQGHHPQEKSCRHAPMKRERKPDGRDAPIALRNVACYNNDAMCNMGMYTEFTYQEKKGSPARKIPLPACLKRPARKNTEKGGWFAA